MASISSNPSSTKLTFAASCRPTASTTRCRLAHPSGTRNHGYLPSANSNHHHFSIHLAPAPSSAQNSPHPLSKRIKLSSSLATPTRLSIPKNGQRNMPNPAHPQSAHLPFPLPTRTQSTARIVNAPPNLSRRMKKALYEISTQRARAQPYASQRRGVPKGHCTEPTLSLTFSNSSPTQRPRSRTRTEHNIHHFPHDSLQHVRVSNRAVGSHLVSTTSDILPQQPPQSPSE